ncbi:MAG: hypothetical protein ACLSAH_10840 [Bilophila wadsworthia]
MQRAASRPVRGTTQLSGVLAALPEHMHLSLGVVDGRNIWKTNCAAALSSLRNAALKLGSDRLFVGSSSSLLHVPVDLELETSLDPKSGTGWPLPFRSAADRPVGANDPPRVVSGVPQRKPTVHRKPTPQHENV